VFSPEVLFYFDYVFDYVAFGIAAVHIYFSAEVEKSNAATFKKRFT
jgi:hypothetical protein